MLVLRMLIIEIFVPGKFVTVQLWEASRKEELVYINLFLIDLPSFSLREAPLKCVVSIWALGDADANNTFQKEASLTHTRCKIL